jgi:hypothetical protein
MELGKNRKIKILLMSLAYMYKYGEPFVDLVKGGSPEENASAWKILKEQIKQLHSELRDKLEGQDS